MLNLILKIKNTDSRRWLFAVFMMASFMGLMTLSANNSVSDSGVNKKAKNNKKLSPEKHNLVVAQLKARNTLKALLKLVDVKIQMHLTVTIEAQKRAITRAKTISQVPTKESMEAAINQAIAQVSANNANKPGVAKK